MSWGYRLSVPEGARAPGIEIAQPFDTRVVISGKRIPYLERVNGKAKWGASRYGMTLYNSGSGKLFWNAKKEALQTNETWSRLIRMRIAIPIDAYVESSPVRKWMVGERSWIPGLLNPAASGGIVAITESDEGGGGNPILLTQEAAINWLDSKDWNAIKALEGERVPYEEADVFVAARLDMESKSKIPIAA